MELTARDKRWIAAVGMVGIGIAACYAAWGDESDYPLPYKRRDASVLGRIALEDPSTRNTAVAADDRTITMDVAWNGCDYRPDLMVRETNDQVTLLLKRRDASGPDIGCEDGGIAQLKVVLHQPLGTRALTDTVTGKPVPHTHA
ncbi:hypothetical protein KV557_38720 [Kitasatospora aureofaciens]|uniref:hypothetical protein n=1 Tax=Kitasatospora aureofaciens TaxID=1894 RepID=UPI001C482E03|nr:hypothetical protein [Kitasatospora aureofaciens]MBV6702968.1 hypothetical protein [Kitasatospora aureofaciens]